MPGNVFCPYFLHPGSNFALEIVDLLHLVSVGSEIYSQGLLSCVRIELDKGASLLVVIQYRKLQI